MINDDVKQRLGHLFLFDAIRLRNEEMVDYYLRWRYPIKPIWDHVTKTHIPLIIFAA